MFFSEEHKIPLTLVFYVLGSRGKLPILFCVGFVAKRAIEVILI